eukprot:TRINITY_DN1002_c1_g1_i1.p1 TRINITY_DN1002_c1_g1~~TRINITY_DN1002_c1_g1_i1.p1  ORF type:complete len:171 (+),score=19.81 TRINITY_DN1002_c1_g1_i1:102-614(+)
MAAVAAYENIYYVHCNFCNTILAVSVPCSSLFNVVTVRCGHCANLLSVNLGALLQTLTLQEVQDYATDYGSSSECNKISTLSSIEKNQPPMVPMRPAPEKRHRGPSAYNRFIKEEIQRIKASNPDISHREAFSTAAKNWAHFPHIHFGLRLDENKEVEAIEEGLFGGRDP